MDITNSTASTKPDAACYACYEGVVYLGHLIEDLETGEAVEVYEPVACRRCEAR